MNPALARVSDSGLRTVSDAVAALRTALESADNPVAAGRALLSVAERFHPSHVGSEDAFRREAEKLLQPFASTPAKATRMAVWNLLDAVERKPVGNLSPARGSPTVEPRSLADILGDPGALEAPEVVVPRLAWRERVTMLAAREKAGKSSLAGSGAAAISVGRPFLGESTTRGTALILNLEEHVGDLARRLVGFNAIPERIHVLDRVDEPLRDLQAAIETVKPDLVIVDSLAAFVEVLTLDSGAASSWTPIMLGLTRIAQDHNTAILLLHHGTKSDGSYRDSTAIGAGVDVILEMRPDTADPWVRQIRARGRFTVSNFAVRLVEHLQRFELAGGELSLDARIILAMEGDPGLSKRATCTRVEGKTADILTEIDRLISRGAIEDRGSDTHSALFPVRFSQNPPSNATETVGKRLGNGDGAGECFPGGGDPTGLSPHTGNARTPSAGGTAVDLDLGDALAVEGGK